MNQERGKTNVNLDETKDELGDRGDEGDELAEASDERHDDHHQEIDAVMVHRRHRALTVPRLLCEPEGRK